MAPTAATTTTTTTNQGSTLTVSLARPAGVQSERMHAIINRTGVTACDGFALTCTTPLDVQIVDVSDADAKNTIGVYAFPHDTCIELLKVKGGACVRLECPGPFLLLSRVDVALEAYSACHFDCDERQRVHAVRVQGADFSCRAYMGPRDFKSFELERVVMFTYRSSASEPNKIMRRRRRASPDYQRYKRTSSTRRVAELVNPPTPFDTAGHFPRAARTANEFARRFSCLSVTL